MPLVELPGEPPAAIAFARIVFVSAMTYGQKPQAIECFEDAALVRTDVPVILADQAKRLAPATQRTTTAVEAIMVHATGSWSSSAASVSPKNGCKSCN